MFTLTLYYPDHTWTKPNKEEIRGGFIPPVGMVLTTPRGLFSVKEVTGDVEGGVLNDKISIRLEWED